MQVSTNSALYELKKHGTDQFPLQTYLNRFEGQESVNPHWHQDLELIYGCGGVLSLWVNGKAYTLKEKEGLFINSNALHELKAQGPQAKTRCASIVFAPSFIAPINSMVFQEAVYPILASEVISAYPLSESVDWQKKILSGMKRLIALNEDQASNCLKIHNTVGEIWETFTYNTKALRKSAGEKPSKSDMSDRQRARQMLRFIYENFAEALSANDIAEAADISRSEAFRCFRRMVGKRPMEFLNEYRLEQAARLLRATDLSICQISSRCGFNHQSYFGKNFKGYYKMTPIAFRKAGAAPQK